VWHAGHCGTPASRLNAPSDIVHADCARDVCERSCLRRRRTSRTAVVAGAAWRIAVADAVVVRTLAERRKRDIAGMQICQLAGLGGGEGRGVGTGGAVEAGSCSWSPQAACANIRATSSSRPCTPIL